MPNLSVITIAGHVGRDAELKKTDQGIPYCTFSIAVNHRTDKELTTWYNVTVWRKYAEILAPVIPALAMTLQRVMLLLPVASNVRKLRNSGARTYHFRQPGGKPPPIPLWCYGKMIIRSKPWTHHWIMIQIAPGWRS